MNKTIRLMVGVHSHGTAKIEMVGSLVNAVASTPYPKVLYMKKHAYPPKGKNDIIKKAIELDVTHVFIVDCDMEFPADSITRLLAHNVDMVGGLYYKREFPKSPIIRQERDGKLYVPERWEEDKLFKVFSVGGGFLLAKVKMLKDIKYPWFSIENVWNGQELGDDVYFCKKINDAGYTVWCDPTIPITHIGDFPY